MLARTLLVRSRVQLAVAMVAVMGVAGAYMLLRSADLRQNYDKQLSEDRQVAAIIAADVGKVDGRPRLRAYVPLLVQEGERATVRLEGRRWSFGSRLHAGKRVATAAMSFPGGPVTVTGMVDSSTSLPLDFTAVTTGVLLLVLGTALLAYMVLNKETRRRVDAAVIAAERIAGGDFGARVGTEGLESLARLGKAFDAMAVRLEAADRDQRELLADLAHEIATPLNAVSGFAIAMADGKVTKERAVSVIEVQTARLADLLDRLAQFRAVEGVLSEPACRGAVDLGELCREVVAQFTLQAEESGTRLALHARRLAATTDRRLVEIVVTNLVSNALRYTPRGGRVDLVLRAHPKGFATIAVRDSGIGIAEEHRERIFDRFYRVSAARDRASGGSGLGLALARRAAHSLGGRIELSSTRVGAASSASSSRSTGRGNQGRLTPRIFEPTEPGDPGTFSGCVELRRPCRRKHGHAGWAFLARVTWK
ncbi:MAG: HAMP domain-containing sensor histidine kinase [Acidimicrobiales bacterium]